MYDFITIRACDYVIIVEFKIVREINYEIKDLNNNNIIAKTNTYTLAEDKD